MLRTTAGLVQQKEQTLVPLDQVKQSSASQMLTSQLLKNTSQPSNSNHLSSRTTRKPDLKESTEPHATKSSESEFHPVFQTGEENSNRGLMWTIIKLHMKSTDLHRVLRKRLFANNLANVRFKFQ